MTLVPGQTFARCVLSALLIALVSFDVAAGGQQAPAPKADDAAAADAAPAVDLGPRSGDAWIDAQIRDISVYGNRYRGAFVDEVVRYHAGPRGLVAELLASRGWQPGDVYYACALAQTAGRPCRAAVAFREQSPDAGWEAVAGELGLAGDADALARLKLDITESYRHWARPLAKPLPVSVKGGAPAGRTDKPSRR